MKQGKGDSKGKLSKEPIPEKRKQYIVTKMRQKKMSLREAAERFNVPKSTLNFWGRAHMAGKPFSLNKVDRNLWTMRPWNISERR